MSNNSDNEEHKDDKLSSERPSQAELLAEIAVLKNCLGIANQKLVDSASMSIVGQLAAAVGHEVNNPLQVLRSCLEYLGEDHLALARSMQTEETTEVVHDAILALSQIESVVSELIPFARPVRDETSPVDINEAVVHSLRIANNELRHRTQVVQSLGEIPSIRGISAHIHKMLTGLFVSVARQMHEDCEDNVLTVSTDSDGNYVYVRLHCHLQQATNFFQELSERLRNTDSMHSVIGQKWITLLFCQQIAISHGGTLAVHAIEDGSVQISLRLPIQGTMQLDEPNAPRVLVIDDDKLVLRGLQRMLSSPFAVDSAESGNEALEKISNVDYDVIVCDIMMPGLSGVGVYERLKQIRPDAQKRIIFISAGAFTEQSQDFAEATKQPVLAKPISRHDLIAALEELLAKR